MRTAESAPLRVAANRGFNAIGHNEQSRTFQNCYN